MISNKTRIIMLACLCVILGSVSFAWISKATADAQRPGLVMSGSFPEWKYEVWREQDGHMVARVHYPNNSVTLLRRYPEVNDALARQLRQEGVQEFFGVITFNAPMSLNEFRSWTSTSSFRVEGFTLRVMAKDGSRVTVGGMPSANQLIQEEQLNRALARVAAHGASEVKGIISVEGVLPAKDFAQVAANSKVFLVDITRSAVLQHIASVAPDIKLSPRSILIDPTYPKMEDLGLVQVQ